ncbi:MAG: alpha/beta fold hydrolase [Pseudomonadota bacterium]
MHQGPITSEVTEERVQIPAGMAVLRGTVFAPNGRAQAMVLLNGATGVPQSYYRAFATWLAARLMAVVVTYDYRDFGRSRTGPIKRSPATMMDWGIADQEAVRRVCAARFPELPIVVLGHSLGGLTLPYQTQTDQVRRVATVASGIVHVADHPWPYQAVARTFWHALGPALVGAFGYLPKRWSGFPVDMPAGVYWQWRRWCTNRDFNRGAMAAAGRAAQWSPATPVTLISFTDDHVCPMVATDRLAALYGPAAQIVSIAPGQVGLDQVGHIHAFSPRCQALWPRIAKALAL